MTGGNNRASSSLFSPPAKKDIETQKIDRSIKNVGFGELDAFSLSPPPNTLSNQPMFNGGAPGLGGAPVTKALLLAVGGASLALRIRSGGGDSPAAAGPLARSLGFSTAGELIFAAALLYQSRAAERAMGPSAAASGAALGGLGGAALAALARALLSALFGRRAVSGMRGGGGGGAKATALGPYPLVFALLVPLVLDVPATTSIVLAGPSSSSAASAATPANDAASTSSASAAASSSSSPSPSTSSRGIKITDKHFLYFEAAQLLFIGGRRAWLPALAGVAAGAAVRFDVAGLGSLRFPPLVSAAAAKLLGPLLGWAPIKECVVLPSAANAAAAAARGRFSSGGGYGLGVAGRAPPPPPPGGAASGAWAAAAAEPSAASVAQLVAMGFSEPDARAALRRRGGDVSAALSDLLG